MTGRALIATYLLLGALHAAYYAATGIRGFIPERRAWYAFLLLIPILVAREDRIAAWISKARKKNLWPVGGLLLLALIFLNDYARAGGFAGKFTASGAGTDQWHYYRMAEKIRHWSLGAVDYNYGLGYPILGAVFGWFYAADSYLIPDLILFVATVALVFRILSIFELPVGFSAAVCLYLAVNPYWLSTMEIPWSSTVSIAAYAALILIAFKSKRSPEDWLGFGALMGLLFAARYVDVVLSLPVALVLLRRDSLRKGWPGIVVFLCVVAGVFLSHKLILGGFFRNPYQWHHHPGETTTDGDAVYYWKRLAHPLQALGHLYGQWVEAGAKRVACLFHVNPLLAFGPLGLVIHWKRLKTPNEREKYLALLAGAAFFLVIYSVHPGTSPGSQVFGSLHYFKPVSILLAAGGARYFYDLFSDRTSRIQNAAYGFGLISLYALIGLVLRIAGELN